MCKIPEKTYRFSGHGGYRQYEMTAKQLYDRIMSDRKSAFNWVAPAYELVRVCRKTSFPAEYAVAIEAAILDCYARIDRIANDGGDLYGRYEQTGKAVAYCFDALRDSQVEEVMKARRDFLREEILLAIHPHFAGAPWHVGDVYRAMRDEWVEQKVDEYLKLTADFTTWRKGWREEFAKLIQEAETRGDFRDDDAAWREEMSKLARRFYT